MQQGWIKLHRQIREHSFFEKKRKFSKFEAWIDILLEVNHRKEKFLLGNEWVECDKAQTITSIRKLSERWGWSKTKVVSYLKLLKNDQMIDFFSDTKKTVLTVLNWDKYQSGEDTKRTQKGHEPDAKRTQNGTNKNVKNEKNNKYSPHFEEFWKHYPRKIEKKTAYSKWNARIKEGYEPKKLIFAAKNYAAYCKKQGTESNFMKHASTFIGPNKPFEEYIKPIAVEQPASDEPLAPYHRPYKPKGDV